ncbi:MAG: hypothetical protein LBM08_12710 [Dysgonamonadaceae bacterium]|jgi:hypothetical protein|nr:hypothetical protein [Dysgonamonadaceae bacterium]
MKIIIKNIAIVLKRFRLSCILAVVSLAVAYFVFYLPIVHSYYDLNFDRNFEKSNSIFLYSRIVPNFE